MANGGVIYNHTVNVDGSYRKVNTNRIKDFKCNNNNNYNKKHLHSALTNVSCSKVLCTKYL